MSYERMTQKQYEKLRELIKPEEWPTISPYLSQREASDLIFLRGHQRAMECIERNTLKYSAKPVPKPAARYSKETWEAFMVEMAAQFAAWQAEREQEREREKSKPRTQPSIDPAVLIAVQDAAGKPATPAPSCTQVNPTSPARPPRTANITAPLFPYRKRRNVFTEIVPPPEIPATAKQHEALLEFYDSASIAKMGRKGAAAELFHRLQPLFFAGRPGLKPTKRQKRFLERYGLWKKGMSRSDAGFTIASMYYQDLQ